MMDGTTKVENSESLSCAACLALQPSIEEPGFALILVHFAGLRPSGALASAAHACNRAVQPLLPALAHVAALQCQREQFWRPLLETVEGAQALEHVRLCIDAENVVHRLTDEHEYVRSALREAVACVRAATEAVLAQSLRSVQVASERLQGKSGHGGDGASGSGDLFLEAVRQFVGEGAYSTQLSRDVVARQAEILPVLRGTAALAGSVCQGCRLASKRGFDVLKYDIYNRGVPKTPEDAKRVAERLIQAAGHIREHFTSVIKTMVRSITQDAESTLEAADAGD